MGHGSPQSFAQLLTLKEAAPLLGMHWKTLEILACHGEIPAIKIGKKWRFRGVGLAQWLSCESGAQLRNSCFVSERAQAHSSVVVHGPPSDSENARGCKGG
jgi:excisionase family DNA binding protein